MKLSLALATGAIVAAGFATPSFAAAPAPFHPGFQPGYQQPAQPMAWRQPQAWKVIGQSNISGRGGRDTIPAYGRARFQQVMVCVYRQAVRFNDLDVNFANGGSQDVGVRNVIGAGQCTRAIDLNGQARDIKSVSLAAKSLGFGYGAQVKVFAR